MPRRTDITSVMVIGSGPIVIGQACEFDYSGTQACRVLRDEGLRVILVNSNPATIMTDPEFADADLRRADHPGVREKIIDKERPDALLPTLGGQTALNAAMALHADGTLEKYGVELIGANVEAIERGENRERFKEIVASIGAESARSVDLPHDGRLPRGRRGSRLPGGRAPVVHDGRRRLGDRLRRGRPARGSPAPGCRPRPTTEVLLEESILGLEGVRARADARPQRQRRGRLLDRERRPDGRAHRRLHHGGARADADRPRVPAHARRRHRRSSARSASTPAAATSSSRSTPTTAA